jgi:cytochrome c peroxidase
VGVQAHGDKQDDEEPAQILAPGYAELSFAAPAVGSYELPILGVAGDGEVLDTQGDPVKLHALIGQKPTLLSFVYTSCDEINGCPLATFVLSQVNRRIQAHPTLRGNVRLISLSFDPHHDTPQVMQAYGRSFKGDGDDWQFVTAADERRLEPILSRYNQTVTKEYDAEGEPTSRYSHILRVYLIDRQRNIRNIYSVSFLHADTIMNDIQTLALGPSIPRAQRVGTTTTSLHGAGDYKSGYDRSDYETRSAHLPNRLGKPHDLLSYTKRPTLGLPPINVPADNPLTKEKVRLGRKLFFDRRLSLNQTLSCAMCHVPEQGFTHNEIATAVGLEGRTVRRNSPTMYNVGYQEKLFHDGRDDRLEHQIWQPLLARNEMANPSVSVVINKLRRLPDYAMLFEAAFDGAPAGIATIGKAIASYERTLISGNSPFDQWHFGEDENAVSEKVQRGFNVFSGKGRCSTCHLVESDHALFTDNELHNTGVGYRRSMQQVAAEPQRILLAPGIFIDVDPNAVRDSAEKPPADLGYYEITQDPRDRWKYRTPMLRNIALTAPYMHDGSLTTLESVVEFYAKGGIENELRDPLIQPLNLTGQDKSDLVEFLKSLTGDSVERIISDAFDAPVGNHGQNAQ